MSDKKENEETIKERVDSITTRTFWITNCPEKVWEEFSKYAKDETNNNYSIALKLLLGTNKSDAKSRVLYERYIQLDMRLRQAESNIVQMAKSMKVMSEVVSTQEDKDIEDEIEDDSVKKVTVPTMGGNSFKYTDKTKKED